MVVVTHGATFFSEASGGSGAGFSVSGRGKGGGDDS